MQAVPITRADGEGERRSFLGGGLHTWKLSAEETNGACFLFEDTMARGKTTPLHRHPEADEMIYLLEGVFFVHAAATESRDHYVDCRDTIPGIIGNTAGDH